MKKYLTRTIKWLIIFCLLLVMAIPAAAGIAPPDKEGPLVKATFFETDLREALHEIALQTKIAINLDENVKGIITMDINNIPLEKALRMMVSGGGYVFRKFDNYYVVGSPDPKSPTYQVLCETTVYYFKNASFDSVKMMLPDNYRNYIKLDPEKSAALITAPSSLLPGILADFALIDNARTQVRIKALVTEVQTDSLKELGINLLNINSNPQREKLDGLQGAESTLDTVNGFLTYEQNKNFGYLFMKIKALSGEKKARIQADPVLLVSEGKTGSLFVGEKDTIILQPDNSYISGTQQTIEAGITLKVTPRVCADCLELTVVQKVSGIQEEKTDRVLVKTREFESVVRIIPGQTIMVAGLTGQQTVKKKSMVPILGNIPLIGIFFREKTDSKTDSETLIFLTAEIVQ